MTVQSPHSRRVSDEPQDRPAPCGDLQCVSPGRIRGVQRERCHVTGCDVALASTDDVEGSAVQVERVRDTGIKVVDLSQQRLMIILTMISPTPLFSKVAWATTLSLKGWASWICARSG